MSYDITLVEDHFSSNYTSNIYTMVQAAFKKLKEDGKVQLWHHNWHDPLTDSLEPEVAKDYLKDLIQELKNNPKKYEKLQPKIDPKTGERWGSYEGCIEWLEGILLNWKSGYRLEIDK